MTYTIFRFTTLLMSLLVGSNSLHCQPKAGGLPAEGKIYATLDVISQRGIEPLDTPTVLTFYDKMLIEPLYFIKVTDLNGEQTKSYVSSHYNIINLTSATYSKIEKLSCDSKPIESGALEKKSEGIFLTDDRDLFKEQDNVLHFSDTVVSGVKYQRYQVNTIDLSTKRNVLAIAYTKEGVNKLPISLSRSLENKHQATVAFIDVFYDNFKGFLRMAYRYEPYQLTDNEKKVLQCFK